MAPSDAPLPPPSLDRTEARDGAIAGKIGGLRVRFGSHGAQITARGGERVDVSLERIGRRGAIVASESPTAPRRVGCQSDPFADDADGSCRFRVERTGTHVTEWWQGDKRGLEQGWKLGARPEGDGPLSLVVGIEGDIARVEMLERANTARIVLKTGRVLLYGEVRAWDATGTTLPSALRYDGRSFAIEVDDAGAVYPITVDPLIGSKGPINSRRKIAKPNARFGDAVAGAGDVNGDGFDDVLVGAPSHDTTKTKAGRVYLYAGSPFGLSAAPLSFVDGDVANANFGASVAGAGDVNKDGYADVLVGAPNTANGQLDEGRVYLYLGGPNGLSSTPAWTFEPNFAKSNLGSAVASIGDVNKDGFIDIAVGASGDDGSVASGETVFTAQGSVHVFYGSKDGFPAQPSVKVLGGSATAHFGAAIAAAGDANGDGFADVLVGAPDATATLTGEGRVQLFLGSAAGLSKTPSWTKSGGSLGARFGAAVSAGDTNGDGKPDAIIGSPAYSNVESLEGRVTFLFGNGKDFGTDANDFVRDSIEYQHQNAKGGAGVAFLGDVDGDGFGDVSVGHPSTPMTVQVSNVYLGSRSGPSHAQPFATKKDTTGGVPDPAKKLFPWLSIPYSGSTAAAGDIDGDGFADVVYGELEGLCVNKCWDYDGDGYEDVDETDATPVTDPFDWDTDGDGCSDFVEGGWYETARARNPNLKPADTKVCDSDKDGLTDAQEAVLGTNPNAADSDGDTIDDFVETHGGHLVDTDGDKSIDALDTDSDGDGVPDALEGTRDRDRDRIPGFRDTDDDNDGVPTSVEWADGQRVGSNDTDGDGIFNWEDSDADGDGKPDTKEDAAKDDDGDGIPNYLDLDDTKAGPFFGAPPSPSDAGTTPTSSADGGTSDAGPTDAGPVASTPLPAVEEGCSIGSTGPANGGNGSLWLSALVTVGFVAAQRKRSPRR